MRLQITYGGVTYVDSDVEEVMFVQRRTGEITLVAQAAKDEIVGDLSLHDLPTGTFLDGLIA